MSKHRVAKGIAAQKLIEPTLSNLKIPLMYKKLLIQNFLSPVLSYGSEIFGMNENRIKKLKRVVDNSLKRISQKGLKRKPIFFPLEHCKGFRPSFRGEKNSFDKSSRSPRYDELLMAKERRSFRSPICGYIDIESKNFKVSHSGKKRYSMLDHL